MSVNLNNSRRSALSRFLNFLCCCCRGSNDERDEQGIDADDIIVTRVYKSSSAVVLNEHLEIVAGLPYMPKASKSDIDITRQTNDRQNMERSNVDKRGKRKQKKNQIPLAPDTAATFDVGGDVADVNFDDSEGLEVLNAF